MSGKCRLLLKMKKLVAWGVRALYLAFLIILVTGIVAVQAKWIHWVWTWVMEASQLEACLYVSLALGTVLVLNRIDDWTMRWL
jgi:hypothetical protein